MSEVTSSNQNRNQITNSYDFSKMFLFDNRYRKVNIANASGNDLELKAGMVIGAVGATHSVYKSGTANQLPVGILAEDITIANGNNADVNICYGGRVAENKVKLDGNDTLATVVNNRTIRDMIISNSYGIELIATDELTKSDNV